jgi:hypothetical protein
VAGDVRITSDLQSGRLFWLLNSPDGPVARAILRDAHLVVNQAKRNLMGRNGAPRRVKTGRLLNSISVEPIRVNGAPAARVGTSVYYAKYVLHGTGIYGPRGAPIVPRHARWLRWEGPHGTVFARSVRGMEANHFLTDALHEVFGRR